MKSLLVIAHGSRRSHSNTEVLDLVAALKASLKDSDYIAVEAAFLELAEPDIPTGIQTCVDVGSTQIDILPYFLSAGRHVSEDIPEFIQTAKTQHPAVQFHTLNHFGAMPELALLLSQLLVKQAS